jgi:hypothetical protein
LDPALTFTYARQIFLKRCTPNSNKICGERLLEHPDVLGERFFGLIGELSTTASNRNAFVLQVNMAAIINAGTKVFNEWVLAKRGKYSQDLKQGNI